MKYVFIIFGCVMLAACQDEPIKTQSELCVDEQKLTDGFVSDIRKIDERPTIPTQADVIFLIRFLPDDVVRLNFNHGACQGYYEQVRDATLKTLKNRARDISPILIQLAGEEDSAGGNNMTSRAAINESQKLAKMALNILNAP